MRICFVTKFPPIQGGVSARAALLADELAIAGHEVFVVSNGDDCDSRYRVWIPPDYSHPASYAGRSDGRVRVFPVPAPDPSLATIPRSPATVSRLAAAAIEVLNAHRCRVIFSNYLEPYAIAGQLAGRACGVPHVIKTAGSDRVRLMGHHAVSAAYKAVMRDAAGIVDEPTSLLGLGIEPDVFTGSVRSVVPARLFASPPTTQPGVVLCHLIEAARHQGVCWGADGLPAQPIVGVYGKPSPAKGFFDLVEALAVAARNGVEFSLVGVVGGHHATELREAVIRAGLAARTWLLPFLPYPLIPPFLRACALVACLERRFPIQEHTPVKVREVLACGTGLVVSGELATKDPLAAEAAPGLVTVVDDPRDTAALAEAITTRLCARDIRVGPVTPTGDERIADDSARWARQYADVFATVAAPARSAPRTPLADRIQQMLPLTAELLGTAFHDAVTSFTRDDGSDRLVTQIAHDFAHELMTMGRYWSTDIPEWLWRYQYGVAWLSLDVEFAAGTVAFGWPADTTPDGAGPVLRRTNLIRLVPVPPAGVPGWGRIGPVTRRMLETTIPSPLPRDATALLLRRRLNLKKDVYLVGVETCRALELCDGTRSESEVVTVLNGQGRAGAACLRKLRELDIVRQVTPGATGPSLPELWI